VQTAATPATRKPQRLKWGVGISLIVAGIAALAFWAVDSPGALAYYKSPTQVADEHPSEIQNIRVGGRVTELVRSARLADFVLTDGKHSVRIDYHGEVPDTLKNGTDGIAEGHMYADGTLHATQVQAKCSSKFMTKQDAKSSIGKP
jgi:cytochrome c-type biogenesis protein CcmE